MHMQQNGCIMIAVTMFAAIAVVDGASCNNKFSGLTTCAVLNGMSRSLEANTLGMTITQVESQISMFYNNTVELVKSDLCKGYMYNVSCIGQGLSFGLSSSTCEPIKVCFESCLEYVRTCGINDPNPEKSCELLSAPRGTDCYASSGTRINGTGFSTTTVATTSTTTPKPIITTSTTTTAAATTTTPIPTTTPATTTPATTTPATTTPATTTPATTTPATTRQATTTPATTRQATSTPPPVLPPPPSTVLPPRPPPVSNASRRGHLWTNWVVAYFICLNIS